MDMRIDAAGRNDAIFAGDGLRSRPDDDVDSGLDIWVAGLADTADAAVADADIGFDDPPMIEDYRIGDDGIDSALGACRLPLPHAVADDFATPELDLFAVDRVVVLNFDDEIGICQPHPVPGRRSEHRRICAAWDRHRHRLSQPTVDPGVEADDAPLAHIGNESDLTALPRLEPNRSPSWDVEPASARLFAIKGQRRVGLVKMIMRADLYRAVAGIRDHQRQGRAAGINLDVTRGDEELTGDHIFAPSLRGPPDGRPPRRASRRDEGIWRWR